MYTESSDPLDDETQCFGLEPASLANASAQLWSKAYVQLLAVQFMFGLGFSTFYLLPKYLQQVYAANAATIGRITGAALLTAVLTTPIAAIWVGRGKRRAPAFAGLILLAASAVAFSFVDQIGWLMLLLRGIQGAAFCLFTTAIVTRAAEIVPHERMGQAIGYLGLAALVTNALSPVIAEPFADLLGWPSVFLLAALWGTAAAVTALQMGDPPEGSAREPLDFGVLLKPALRSVLFSAMICGVALGVMFTYTQPLAMVRGARRVGMFFSGFALFAGCVRLFLGNLADRMGRKGVSIVAMLAYGFVLLLTASVTPGTLFWAGAGLGAAHGILYPALNALAFEHSSINSRGMVAAAFSGAFSLGYALGVLNLGFVADRWGLPIIFIMTAGCTLSGAWVLGTLRPIAPVRAESKRLIKRARPSMQ